MSINLSLLGLRVKLLLNLVVLVDKELNIESRASENHESSFSDGRNLSSGVYLLVLDRAGSFVELVDNLEFVLGLSKIKDGEDDPGLRVKVISVYGKTLVRSISR